MRTNAGVQHSSLNRFKLCILPACGNNYLQYKFDIYYDWLTFCPLDAVSPSTLHCCWPIDYIIVDFAEINSDDKVLQ